MRPTRLLEDHESKDLNRSNYSNWLIPLCAEKLAGALRTTVASASDSLIPETRPWYIKRPDAQIIMLTGNVTMIALVAGDMPISQIADIGIIDNAQGVGT